jgi:hypothetical protein
MQELIVDFITSLDDYGPQRAGPGGGDSKDRASRLARPAAGT